MQKTHEESSADPTTNDSTVVGNGTSSSAAEDHPAAKINVTADSNVATAPIQVVMPSTRDLPESFYALSSSDVQRLKPSHSALDTSFRMGKRKAKPTQEELEAVPYKIKLTFPCGAFVVFDHLSGGNTVADVTECIRIRLPYLPPMKALLPRPSNAIMFQCDVDNKGALSWSYPTASITPESKLMSLNAGNQFALRFLLCDLSKIVTDKSSPAYSENRLKLIDVSSSKWVGFKSLPSDAENIKIIQEPAIIDTQDKDANNTPTGTPQSTKKDGDKGEKKMPKWFKHLGK